MTIAEILPQMLRACMAKQAGRQTDGHTHSHEHVHTHPASHHSYSPGTPGPEGSSHTVGSVFSQAAQFISSTLKMTAALMLQDANDAASFVPREGPQLQSGWTKQTFQWTKGLQGGGVSLPSSTGHWAIHYPP